MSTSVIAVIISGIVCLFSILTFIIARKKDDKQVVTEELLKFDGIKESLLKVNMKLDQVCATTVETHSDIKVMNNQLVEMDKRIALIEKDNITVWRRIDELRENVDELKDK